MKTVNHRAVFAFALTALVAALHTAPAHAGGRSGAHAVMAEPRTQATERQSQMENRMQAQIETLRKEVDALKAQQAMNKNDSAAK